MTAVLVRKLLRDVRLTLLVVAVLLGAFQCLWTKITARILGDLLPYLNRLASFAGQGLGDIEAEVFKGPGQLIRTLIGGEYINLDAAMDMLSIGYVHPLMQTLFCIWAIGRAAGALAGEIDRGTLELLLAQPLPRWRLVLAHLIVDGITIPLLCLALWAGNLLGVALFCPITPTDMRDIKPPDAIYSLKYGKFEMTVKAALPLPEENPEAEQQRLDVQPTRFLRGLPVVAGLMFAVSGFTMWLSARGRFRWRVLGLAVFLVLIQFLVNVLGQMWDTMEPLRPWTIFYYYQPQQAILGPSSWTVPVYGLRVPMLLVLFGVGAVGYLLALRTFLRRDLPAPL
jgi:ABC-2 type transport system permease protein